MRFIFIAAALLAAGCAKAPEAIVAADVGVGPYMQMSCNQLGEESLRIARQLDQANAAQRQAQTNDAAGVFFVGLPLASMSGGSREGEISRLKGEEAAVRQARASKSC